MFSHEALWDGVERVAARQGWTLSRLASIAGLDPTALNRSKRFGSDGKPRWPSMATVAKLLTATNIPLSEFCRMIEGGGAVEAPAVRRGHVLLVDHDLARLAPARRPDLKVLHVTSYDVGLRQDTGAIVLRKPVQSESLLVEVERIMASRPNSR